MKRLFVAAAFAYGFAALVPASAGPATDALGQCLSKSASPDDQIKLMRWMFSAMALHPAMKEFANISADQRAGIDKEAGGLFERLVTVDCRADVIAALKADGPQALSQSFNTLGQLAAGGLLSAPEVTAGMGGLAANIDNAKLAELQAEASK